MSRNPPFTQAQIRRAVRAAESLGLRVTGFTVRPDGSISVQTGDNPETPVARPKELAASWDDV